ncbi:formin-J isoform X2 [Condylostylus longicornis]|uniref:formin-J isoform X2 n=1 Tax=Condylostylus longicornis TaxID=2530218 RepID=UPI00244DC3C6|nr:formin-J isoform X2 [Condylostylus longicornis]
MGNSLTHHHHHHNQNNGEKYQTDKDGSTQHDDLSQTTTTNDSKTIVRRSSRVKERVLKHFSKRSSKDNISIATQQQQHYKNDKKYEFNDIITPAISKSINEATTMTVTTTIPTKTAGILETIPTAIDNKRILKHRLSDESEIDEDNININLSDTDVSLNARSPSADIDWSSLEFSKMPKTNDSSDTLGSIAAVNEPILKSDDIKSNSRDMTSIKNPKEHLILKTKQCCATKSVNATKMLSQINDIMFKKNSSLSEAKEYKNSTPTPSSISFTSSEGNEYENKMYGETGNNGNDLFDSIMAEINSKQQQKRDFVGEKQNHENIMFAEIKISKIKENENKVISPTNITMPSTYTPILTTDYLTDLNGNNNMIVNNVIVAESQQDHMFKNITSTVPINVDEVENEIKENNSSSKLTNTNNKYSAENVDIHSQTTSITGTASDILRSVDGGSVLCGNNNFLYAEKSEIELEEKNKLNLKVSKSLEDVKLLYKTIEKNLINSNTSEKLLIIQTDSWKTAKLLETIAAQQRFSFTEDQIDSCRIIRLRESSTESESIFTDPITSPSCATDNETTFRSIENGSDSLNDFSQFSKRNSTSTPYWKRQKYIRTLSVLEKLSRSEIVYLSIDSSNSKSNSESPEDDLQMAIHLRNKLAQMLSNEDQKTRVDATTSPGIFNVARAKKVELQNLSSRLADNNLAGISPKILHDVQGTSSQSYAEHDTETSQTLSPSCFGSFSDSNVLKKVASFITADKSGNSDVAPRRSSLIPEKLDFTIYEKFEGQMLVKWITNSLISTGCNLSEQTLNILTQQYCANLLSIGVIKPICEKTDKNDTFYPYQMYQWTHRETIPASNPVTPGRLDAEIIWPHSTTPTSSLKINPRSVQVDISGTSDITQLNNYNNNGNCNNNNNIDNSNNNLNNNNNNCNNNGNVNNNQSNLNNNNIISKDIRILSNGPNNANNVSTNLNNFDNKIIVCGDRKVFELKKSLLNCNTLSEVYEVVETLLPDRKPSSSIIVSYQSPTKSPSALLNESEVTIYDAKNLNDTDSPKTDEEKPSTCINSSTKENLLETTVDNNVLLCCKCGENITEITTESEELKDNAIQVINSVPLKIDQILQTSFEEHFTPVRQPIANKEINEEELIDSTPNNIEVFEAINDDLKTSTPTEEEINTAEPEPKISPVKCTLPPPPPPPVPPPAPPLPPLSLPLPKIPPPPPPALPNFNNQRSTASSSSANHNLPNASVAFRSPQNLQKSISTGSSTSPPSPAPFPMPPTSGTWFQANNTLRKNAVNPPKPMKPLYWTRIVTSKPFLGQSSEEKTDSSPEEEIKEEKPKELWQEIDETSLDNFVIDEFTDLFSRQAVVPQNKPTRVKSNLAKTIKILDSKRSQSVGIFYRSLHFDLEEIEHAIYHCDTSVVSLEILHHIRDIKATPEELAMIKEAANGDTPLDAPEQFLLRISQISSSAERISCLVFQAEFDEGSTLVSRKLEVVKRLSEFLTDSDDLKLLFSIILTLGNYMNGGNRARGQADGFGLEILGKLKDVKSKDSKITLLHFIVKTYIGRKRKSGTPLIEIGLPIPEPSDVERAAAVDFDEIKLQIMDLQKKLRICQNTTEKVIASSNEENIQPFKKKMEDFIEIGDKKIEKQLSKLEESRESFVKTMTFYHFIPKSGELQQCTPAQFFEYWTNFSNDFKDIWKKEITMLTNELLDKVKVYQIIYRSYSMCIHSQK